VSLAKGRERLLKAFPTGAFVNSWALHLLGQAVVLRWLWLRFEV
ncbi:uncharacterized protein METZ01_LOCUS133494, partial [marine metagenome]